MRHCSDAHHWEPLLHRLNSQAVVFADVPAKQDKDRNVAQSPETGIGDDDDGSKYLAI